MLIDSHISTIILYLIPLKYNGSQKKMNLKISEIYPRSLWQWWWKMPFECKGIWTLELLLTISYIHRKHTLVKSKPCDQQSLYGMFIDWPSSFSFPAILIIIESSCEVWNSLVDFYIDIRGGDDYLWLRISQASPTLCEMLPDIN